MKRLVLICLALLYVFAFTGCVPPPHIMMMITTIMTFMCTMMFIVMCTEMCTEMSIVTCTETRITTSTEMCTVMCADLRIVRGLKKTTSKQHVSCKPPGQNRGAFFMVRWR